MSLVGVEDDGDGVVTVTLERPDRLNALSFELVDELLAVLGRLAGDPTARALVLTGAGRAFCAGADLGQLQRILGPDRSGAERNVRHFHEVSAALADMPVPTVAAINGPAVGGGAGIALLCDVRVAGPAAMLRINQLERGIVPDMGATYALPRLLGLAAATDLVLLRRTLDADALLAHGLVSEVARAEPLLERACSIAHDLADVPPAAYRLTLAALQGAHDTTLASALDAEAGAQGICSEGAVDPTLPGRAVPG